MKPFTYWEDLGKPEKTWENLGFGSIQVKLDLGNGQKKCRTCDSGSNWTWEMAKMTWESLGLAPSGGVESGFLFGQSL